ncbi:hypothetical protein LZC95_49850 [Pendulispora brunnea]|uniref:Uncharacterized protein n=1 Tax=Pendulispora brunnea TaxID=2905690 RepID=A0ABZ2KCB0_9BACT
MSQFVMFDNSAVNHLFGQLEAIDEPMRFAIVSRMNELVDSGRAVVILNLAILGEVAGIYFAKGGKNRDRFKQAADFLFKTCRGRLMLPLDQDGLKLRFALERDARGKAGEPIFYRSNDRKVRWICDAFLNGKHDALDEIAAQARDRKKVFASAEQARLKHFESLGGQWANEFIGWEEDPQSVIDEWTLYEMRRSPRYYTLPKNPASWPTPRAFVSLWYARAYHAARLREIGNGFKNDDPGDLYDSIYFQDSAYADILVTADDGIIRRANSVRVTLPRVLRPLEWAREILDARI